jgi:hypothetical protein
MTSSSHRRIARGAALVVVLVPLLLAAPAGATPAAPAFRLMRTGECSGPSHWRLVVRRDARRLLVRFAVRGSAAGQGWNVFMDHNGSGFFAGTRTSGTGGRFVVRRTVANRPGVDRIRAGAHNTLSGEICRGRATP